MAVDADRVVLFAGAVGDPSTGDGYMPAVWLEQEGNEMFIGVGEGVGGMVEGVDDATYAALLERQRDRFGRFEEAERAAIHDGLLYEASTDDPDEEIVARVGIADALLVEMGSKAVRP